MHWEILYDSLKVLPPTTFRYDLNKGGAATKSRNQ